METPKNFWRRHSAALSILVLALVGLAINRAPVGFGNGPVAAASPYESGWVVPSDASTATISLAVVNHGGPATLSSVSLVGARSFAAPVVRSAGVQTTGGCWLSVGSACGHGPIRSLGGAVVPGGSNLPHGPASLARSIVLSVAVPANNCTVVMAVVLHYQDTSKTYSSTVPEHLYACGSRTSPASRASAATH